MFGHLGSICGFIYILKCHSEPRQYGAAVYMLLLVKCDYFYSRTYNKTWAEAHLELNRLLKEELQESSVQPEIDRVVFFQRVAVLYMRYLKLFRQLEKVYDQVIHPQKRRAIRPTLDGVMGRVLELKYDMVETEFSEYHYLDDVLHDMKLTPVSGKLQSSEAVAIVRSFPSRWEILPTFFWWLCCRPTSRSPSQSTLPVSVAKRCRSEMQC